jgi:DNA-binding MarR family transcriptional regulator
MAHESGRDLIILEEIEKDPETTQASLAARMGIAVGTVNWHLKRLIAKGFVKVRRLQRRKLRYMITPEGFSHRLKLTMAYVERTMALYRESRERAIQLITRAKQEGHGVVSIQGDGDIADVVRLTCIEQGMKVVEQSSQDGLCSLVIEGRQIRLRMPEVDRTLPDGAISAAEPGASI